MTCCVDVFFAIAASAAFCYVALLLTVLGMRVYRGDGLSPTERARRKHEKAVAKLRAKGQGVRMNSLASRQVKNIKELAGIVKAQLKAFRADIEFGAYHQAQTFIKDCVAGLHIEKLYSLYSLLHTSDREHISTLLDAFLQKELEYGHIGKHREIHFQNILHGQNGINGVEENQPT